MLLPNLKDDNDLCEFAVELYNSGKLKKEVAEILGMNPRTLYDKLKAFGFSIYKERSKGLSSEQEIKVIDLYEDGVTIDNIVILLDITIQDVRKVFKKFDITPKTPKFYRERYINKDAFSDTNEEECAYYYGWIVSDGCLCSRGVVTLSVHTKDIEILSNLKEYVGGNRVIYSGITKPDPRTGTVYQTSSFSFQDDDLSERLINFGLEQRKSTKETCPEVFKLNRNFWRGMLEGDGCISKTSNNLDLVGSEEIVQDFANYFKFLFPECNPRLNKKGSISVVSLCSKIYSKQILDELYRDCKYKLSRKYKIYLEKYYNGIDPCGTGKFIDREFA